MKLITAVLRFGSINFLRFLAALCLFILWIKTAKNWIWTVNSPPKISVDTRSMRLPKVYELPSTSELGIPTVHDQRIGPFKCSAEDEFNFVASVRMKSFVFYVRPTRFVKCSDRQFYEFYSTTEFENCRSRPQTGTMKEKYFLCYFKVWSVSRRLEDCKFDFALIRFTSSLRGEHGRVFFMIKESMIRQGNNGREVLGI